MSYINQIDLKETNSEFHYPGTNYLGPGTHLFNNVKNKIRPTSYVDQIALEHDLDYTQLVGKSTYDADIKAIKKAFNKPSIQSVAMITGLGTKIIMDKIIGDKFNKPFKDKTAEETYFIGQQLIQEVNNNKEQFEYIAPVKSGNLRREPYSLIKQQQPPKRSKFLSDGSYYKNNEIPLADQYFELVGNYDIKKEMEMHDRYKDDETFNEMINSDIYRGSKGDLLD